MTDKRANFFALAAVICFVLTPLAQDKYREITVGLGAVYVVLALASYADFRGRR